MGFRCNRRKGEPNSARKTFRAGAAVTLALDQTPFVNKSRVIPLTQVGVVLLNIAQEIASVFGCSAHEKTRGESMAGFSEKFFNLRKARVRPSPWAHSDITLEEFGVGKQRVQGKESARRSSGEDAILRVDPIFAFHERNDLLFQNSQELICSAPSFRIRLPAEVARRQVVHQSESGDFCVVGSVADAHEYVFRHYAIPSESAVYPAEEHE